MLRFKILASAVPLVVAALFARGGLLPGPHPCIAIANTSVEIADLPWRADLHVAFTDDPAAATVRVQITESAEAADFAAGRRLRHRGSRRLRGQSRHPCRLDFGHAASGVPVIYLSHDGPADYRIFVRSKTFSQREAAALVVGADFARTSAQKPPRSEVALTGASSRD